jgi:hypothetical protein
LFPVQGGGKKSRECKLLQIEKQALVSTVNNFSLSLSTGDYFMVGTKELID